MLEKIDSRLVGFVTQDVHKATQEAVAQRLRDQAEDLAEWKAESRGAHVSLSAEIKAERERSDTLERQQREIRGRSALSIALAVFSVVGAVISAVVMKGLGV